MEKEDTSHILKCQNEEVKKKWRNELTKYYNNLGKIGTETYLIIAICREL